MPSVLIAGGGLVGSVNACLFAQRGWKVTVLESRPDPRGKSQETGKSINLALGHRAMMALERVDLKEKVIEMGVPLTEMKFHVGNGGGSKQKMPVLNQGDFILSINRHQLCQLLIEKADEFINVKYHFDVLVKGFDFRTQKLTIDDEEVPNDADLILACDGAHSSIRRSVLKHPLFDFEQKYIEFGYMDLSIKLESSGQFELGVHNTWIRDRVIVVAILNRDETLTVSLFAKLQDFQRIYNDYAAFFKNTFPEIFDVLGEEHIAKSLELNDPQAIISVKCSQHAFFHKLVLMGDAAHAMVPFNGQGVNCGMEDCLVLQEKLDKKSSMDQAIEEYSRWRVVDTNAMNRMAWNAHMDIDRLVSNLPVPWINKLDGFVRSILRKMFTSPQMLITFSSMPYSRIEKQIELQDKIVRSSVLLIIISFIGLWIVLLFLF